MLGFELERDDVCAAGRLPAAAAGRLPVLCRVVGRSGRRSLRSLEGCFWKDFGRMCLEGVVGFWRTSGWRLRSRRLELQDSGRQETASTVRK